MAGIKEVNTSSASPASAEPEVQADQYNARVEAQVQAVKLNIRTEAGRILMEGAARQMERTREQLAESQKKSQEEQDADDQEQSADTARLSAQSRWFGVEGRKLEAEQLKWILEMEQDLWESFLYWTPAPGQNLSDQLAKLSGLYLTLLEKVLTHTMGAAQAEQTGRLDTVLAEKLNLLFQKNFRGLEGLFEETGQTKALQSLKASLYRQTTGTAISPGKADLFFSRGRSYSAGSSSSFPTAQERASGPGSQRASSSFRSQEGVLYKASRTGNVQVNQKYEAQKKAGEQDISMRKKVLSAERGRNASEMKALVSANRFAQHLRGRGNLLKSPEFTAQNQELKGFLSALTFIKGQVYTASAGRNSSVETPLQTAVNQVIDHSLRQKDACDVYYHTVGVYEKTKSPQKALEDGFSYAYSHFSQKREHAEEAVKAAYSRQSGFFRPLKQGQPLEADVRAGLKLIDEDWKEFLKAIGEEENRRFVLNLQRYSPWGSQLEPGKQRKAGGGKIVFRTAVLLFALVVGILFLRFLLS